MSFHMTDQKFEDTEPGIGTDHELQDSVVRTNVQEWDEWIAEQDKLIDERLAKYSREDYYSILLDLYEHLNPTVAVALLATVRQGNPSMEWLDHAIVVCTALKRQL